MTGELSNHLWQSTVFVACAAVVAAALRKNGAHIRHAVWVTASVKFLVPFSLLLTLGSQWAWTRPEASVAAPAIETVTVVMDQITQPFTAATPVVAAPPRPVVVWMPTLIACVWACGFVTIVLMRMRGWSRIRAAARAGAALNLPGFNVPAHVALRASAGLMEPGVVGFWRPVLLLPAGIETQLTPLQLEAVLAHELCHIRRRDNVTAAMHMIVEAVFWFHPLVWWIGARMVDERERACDEHVLRVIGEPAAYAQGILNVCKLYVESPLTCVSGVTGSNLKRRIEAIMVNRIGLRLNSARKTAIALAALCALAAPIVIGMITAPIRVRAQTAAAVDGQRFEVASIKPCSGEKPLPQPTGGGPGGGAGQGGGAFTTSPGRVHIECVQLALLVDTAFIQHDPSLKDFDGWGTTGTSYGRTGAGPLKIRGGPSWAYDDRWTIEAKAANAADDNTMLGPMLRALLNDRFQLKLRTQNEDVPVWTLNVAKGGLKIKPMKDGECNPDRTGESVPMSRAIKEGIKPTCGMVSVGPNGPNWRWEQGGMELGRVASMLSVDLGTAVLDRTGITGKFNVLWEYGPDESTPKVLQTMARFAPDAGSPTAANIFTALEEQLGLKLEKTKGPRSFIVIDNVERPTPDAPAPSRPLGAPGAIYKDGVRK